MILIDTGMHETAYLLLENIRKIDQNPANIKKILITHAHIDHMGAAKTIKELTGADIYLGERDVFFLTERKDLLFGYGKYTCGDFLPDTIYDNRPIVLGNISIQPIPTPGHTPGCTSLFFDIHENGRIIRCGIHGGIGFNTLTQAYFKTSGLPITLRDEFLEGLKLLNSFEVDLCLPSHTGQVDILSKRQLVSRTVNPFIDPSIWHSVLNERIKAFQSLIDSENDT